MVISQNTAGHLIIHTDWPSALKNKGVFFVKREKQPVPLDEVNARLTITSSPAHPQDFDLTEFITYGDIYPNALDHFCAWVEEVSEWKNKESSSHLSSFFSAPGPCPHFSERGQHAQIPSLCLV